MTRASRLLVSAFVICFAWACFIHFSLTAAPMPTPDKGNMIALGIVAQTNQKEIQEHFTGFVQYVAKQLSSPTKIDGAVVITPSLIDLAQLMAQGRVDFYMESPYPTYIVNNVHGAGQLLLRRWKSGAIEYRSLIFSTRKNAVRELNALWGKMIAFEDPRSTSGYFLPKLFLQRNGFKLAAKSRADETVAPGEIGYVFAQTQETLVDWVMTNQVAAGAFSNDDYAALEESKRQEINVIAQTELLPRHLLSVRKNLPAPLTTRLEAILRSMHENEEGRRILKETDNTTKFDPLPGGEEGMRRRLLETFYAAPK